MFYRIPPAGNKIDWDPAELTAQNMAEIWQPYSARFYHSGAEALAAAISACLVLQGKQKAEVILPAYSCPELISAVLYAGAHPVLVDFEPQRPWMCLAQLREKITEHTVAIIAVNLFGIAERLDEISTLAHQAGVLLIEDNAQSFPLLGEDAVAWSADLMVISFGRGKPVSLLGGGVVLFRAAKFANALARRELTSSTQALGVKLNYRIKVSLYNLLLSPYLYWLPHSLPFLKLGETRFAYMQEITAFPAVATSLLQSAMRRYRQAEPCAQSLLADMFARLDSIPRPAAITDLVKACGPQSAAKLLRYPVLFSDVVLRDLAYEALNNAGLGVTKMYRQPLTEIAGLEQILHGQGGFDNATLFSSCLLTFPTHAGVKKHHVDKMEKIITELLSEKLDTR